MNAELASLSNQFVYASMTTFTLAFITFAISLAATRGRPAVAAAKVPVAVGANGGFADLSADVEAESTVVAAANSGAGKSGELEPGRRSGNIAMSLTWLSTGLLLIAVLLRGFSAGRVPWGNMYEFSITAALAVAAVYLAVSIKHDLRWLGVVITGGHHLRRWVHLVGGAVLDVPGPGTSRAQVCRWGGDRVVEFPVAGGGTP